MDSELSGIAEEELNWCSCTCLYPESLLLPTCLFVPFLIGLILTVRHDSPRDSPSFSFSFSRVLHFDMVFIETISDYYIVRFFILWKSSASTDGKIEIIYLKKNQFSQTINFQARYLSPYRMGICKRRWDRSRDKIERKKDRRRPLRGEEGRAAVGRFLLGPIKKPVSSSVSKSLLWHSRQLRKHLKAPEKPDNTSLVECRVPPGGRRDFAPCQRDILPPFLPPSLRMLQYRLSILCIKHQVLFPRTGGYGTESSRDMSKSKKYL